MSPLPDAPDDAVLAAMLAVSLDILDGRPVARALDDVRDALAGVEVPLTAPVVAGAELHLAFPSPASAAGAAARIGKALGAESARIAGHYGVAQRIDNPFGGAALVGAAAGVASQLLASVPPGAIHVSETFASALHSWPDISAGETTYVGDLSTAGGSIPLYALAPANG